MPHFRNAYTCIDNTGKQLGKVIIFFVDNYDFLEN